MNTSPLRVAVTGAAGQIGYALVLALDSAGNNMLARIAMMAMTTSNSIKVNPDAPVCGFCAPGWCVASKLSIRSVGDSGSTH